MGRNTSIKTETTDNFSQLVNNMNNQSLDVGATGKLTTTVDSDIVGAINELDSNMGAKTSLTTTNKTSIVNAINEIDSDVGALSNFDADIRDSNFVSTINTLNAKVNAGTSFNASGLDSVGNDSDTLLGGFNDSSERASLVAALNTLSQDIGKLDSNVNRDDRLTTTASTLFGAINELDSDIGARPHTSLNTTAKTLTGAINENKASLNALAVFRNIATDSGSGSISVTVDSANDTLSILSGTSLKTLGIGGNKIQIDHDVSAASSVNNSAGNFIQDLTLDANGHVTGVSSAQAIFDSAGLQTQIDGISFDSSGLQTQINTKLSATTLPNNSWLSSVDGRNRFYFTQNGETYIKYDTYLYFQNNSGVNRFSIDNSGNGIFEGNVTAYGSASDERLKENVEVIPNALEKIKELKGVNFNYKKDGKRSTGLIAQDLQKVLPEAVYTTNDIETKEEHLAINYGLVIGLLVEAIKELESK